MTYVIRFSFYIYKFLGKSVFALKVNLYEKPFMIIMIIWDISESTWVVDSVDSESVSWFKLIIKLPAWALPVHKSDAQKIWSSHKYAELF